MRRYDFLRNLRSSGGEGEETFVDWERGVSCNPATRRSEPEEGVRPGALAARGARRPDVRTKPGVDMGRAGEPVRARLAKEGRTGPGGKPSSQKSPHRAVVG
ncbi:hypothetical protein EVAR_8192_1 [Eumeta japonica]|uniref:Uncharacterized protein n=1 Tax=Eumeta variegata TaxID=151549 RepID=A0A4C1TGM2_EUMVA|nr:hypothetical protein EVAR_8192_1 [Eumeta japonica]